MEKMQVCMTREQRAALAAIAGRTGRTQSELIHEAVDAYIERHGRKNRLELLRSARGMWKTRDDLPNFETLRV